MVQLYGDTVSDRETINHRVLDAISSLNLRWPIHGMNEVGRKLDHDMVWNVGLLDDYGQVRTFSMAKPPGEPDSWYTDEAVRKIQQFIK